MRRHIPKYILKSGAKRWAAVAYRANRFGRDGKLCDSNRRIRGFKTKTAANAELGKILTCIGKIFTGIDNDTYVDPSKQNVAGYLDRWLNSAKPDVTPKESERYEQLVDANSNSRLGAIRLAKVQPAKFHDWSEFRGDRRTGTGLNPPTILHIHTLSPQSATQDRRPADSGYTVRAKLWTHVGSVRRTPTNLGSLFRLIRSIT